MSPTMRTKISRAVAVALVLLLAACTAPGDATRPLPLRLVAPSCARPVDTLLVLLPGAGDRGDDFVDEGFVQAVRSRGIAADVAIVGATVPYYRAGNVVQRLADEVVAPARARGIRHVWIAGVSIGGLGGLIYTNERRHQIDGLLLIAPYLGERASVAEVADAGGLARWSPPATFPDDDHDHRLWQWLQTLTRTAPATATASDAHGLPPVWLGFGVDDRFADAHRLLAAALPSDRVFTAHGGHDWPAWRAVWSAMLDAAPLPRDPSCASPP